MKGIVYCGVNDWHSIKQRPQHLAEQLAVMNYVLYVNTVNYSVCTHLLRKLQHTAHRPWRSRLERLDERLWLFTPAPALPFSRWFRLLNRLNQRWLAFKLLPVLRTLGFSSPRLWLSFPTHVDLIGLLGESRVIVDCLDDYSCFFNGWQQRVISRMETELIRRGDRVLATSQLLFDKCRRFNS